MAEAPTTLETRTGPTAAGFEAEICMGGTPSLRVRRDGEVALEFGLCLVWDGDDIVVGSSITGITEERIVEEFDLLCGKAATHHRADHLERTITFSHQAAGQWQLIVRESDDGAAFRYRVPLSNGELGLAGGCMVLPVETRLWFQAYQTWYENPLHGAWATEVTDRQLGLPVLLHANDHYLLITESDIDRTGSGSHLSAFVRGDSLTLDFQPADANLPVAGGTLTPWRVVLGGTLAAVIESSFVDELARPSTHPMPAWVHPGPAVWSWWSDHYSGSQPAAQRRFIDFAGELGWRHILVDCGWVGDWVPQLVSYASRVGVQVHLWCRWTDLELPGQRRNLGRWAAWGVAGIKVDFMESESNERYRWYEELLDEAYRVGLMVNLHGSVIPRGWARRWPHLLSYEAVRANEYYSFYGEPIPTTHHVILPFTRNVLGSMDFTPVAIDTPMRETTEGGEAATLVLFECGLTHVSDDPDTYRARPALMKLMRRLPDSWDATVLLDGHPDTHVVLGRRSGATWFVSGLATRSGSIRVPLERLGHPRTVWLLTDGEGGLQEREVELDGYTLDLYLPVGGGFVAIPGGLPRARDRIVVDLPVVRETDLVLDESGTATLQADSATRVVTEPDWRAEPLGGGRWLLRSPRAEHSVVMLRREDGGMAHVRVHPPLAGVTRLSELPFASFSNELGPVERDQSNGDGNPNDGHQLTVAGQRFTHGLGSSAPSHVTFFLGGQAARFTALVGIDDETPVGQARVKVLADQQVLWDVELLGGQEAQSVDLILTGARTLTLISNPSGAETKTHVDWAEASVITNEDTERTDANSVDQEGKP